MLGDASFRVLLQVLGYAYPAYLCFKDIERGRPDVLKLWCMYWVVMGAFTAVQPIADVVLFFVPFYYSLKLAFACYLWANNLEGAKMIYEKHLKPFVHEHEPAVDGKIGEVKAVVSNVVMSNFYRGTEYLQLMLIKALTQNMSPQNGVGGENGNERRERHTSEGENGVGGCRSESFRSASSQSSFVRSFSVKDE